MKCVFHRILAIVLTLMLGLLCTTVVLAEEETPVDIARLEELIHIAESAKQSNYTAESWQALMDAVQQAQAALNSNDQKVVDAAKSALALALSKVKRMDYTAVEEALSKVEAFLKTDKNGIEWDALQKAIAEAEMLYESGNQAAVDQAAERIEQCLAELRAESEEKAATPVLWIVLLCVSAAGNLVLAAALVLKLRGNKNQVDDMPLVDYDIDDDIA